jgi:hypothetical protein
VAGNETEGPVSDTRTNIEAPTRWLARNRRSLPYVIAGLVLLVLCSRTASAESSLPPCPEGQPVASWSDCYGTYTTSDGGSYIGELKDGVAHGQGTSMWSDGEKYVGEYRNGLRSGQGTLTLPDGRKYVGGFKDGVAHGQGTYTWPSGEKYVGEFKDNKSHGQGTHTWPDGQKYVGEFKDNKFHGQGTLTGPFGAKYVGLFANGQYVEPVQQHSANRPEPAQPKPMATPEQIYEALKAADAAGNTADAQKLAAAYMAATGGRGNTPTAVSTPAPSENPSASSTEIAATPPSGTLRQIDIMMLEAATLGLISVLLLWPATRAIKRSIRPSRKPLSTTFLDNSFFRLWSVRLGLLGAGVGLLPTSQKMGADGIILGFVLGSALIFGLIGLGVGGVIDFIRSLKRPKNDNAGKDHHRTAQEKARREQAERERHAEERAHQEQAEREQQRRKTRDQGSRPWYEVLGVAATAAPEEVRKAYRSAISRYHPDKVSGLGEELVAVAERMTREINRAYTEYKAMAH